MILDSIFDAKFVRKDWIKVVKENVFTAKMSFIVISVEMLSRDFFMFAQFVDMEDI